MTIKSMTGFAATSGSSDFAAWNIELRSLNGKGLDLQIKSPPSLDKLDTQIRNALKQNLTRGKVSLSIVLKREKSNSSLRLNEPLFSDLLTAANRASEIADLPLTSISPLLSHKNIFEEINDDISEEDQHNLFEGILGSLNEAIRGLISARIKEGANLNKVIIERLDKIEQLTGAAKDCTERKSDAIAARLKSNIQALLKESSELSAERLHQEAVLIAIKSDIAEEIDRLNAHISQARALIASSEPIGRQFDILCQEFNREANTICSKSTAQSLTYIGLEMKTLIDQLREQVQNIE